MKAYWFTDREQGGFPVERAALGSCDLSVLHIAVDGNGWSGGMAGTWRKGPRPHVMRPAGGRSRGAQGLADAVAGLMPKSLYVLPQ